MNKFHSDRAEELLKELKAIPKEEVRKEKTLNQIAALEAAIEIIGRAVLYLREYEYETNE